MGVGARFERFLSNLELRQAEKDDAITKHNRIRGFLHQSIYGTPYTTSTSFLIGSYAKNTAIRPTSDIDIMFILPDSWYDKYSKLAGNQQSRLLQDVKSIIAPNYPRTDVRADGPVVYVPMQSFTVEVAPCFSFGKEYYWICDTNKGGQWKKDDPKAQMAALTASNTRSNGNTIRLIKMMKAWKRTCNVPLKSLALEIAAQNFMAQWQYYANTSVYFDWMVRDFLAYMMLHKNGVLYVPGTTEVLELGEAWYSKAITAHGRAVNACTYEQNKYDNLAIAEWQKIFGDQFTG